MRGPDDKPLKIIQTIGAGDYMTFGMCLLQDENGMEVELIEKNNINKGAEGVTQAILKKWLTSGASTHTYKHLIECLRQSEMDALADNIAGIYMSLQSIKSTEVLMLMVASALSNTMSTCKIWACARVNMSSASGLPGQGCCIAKL